MRSLADVANFVHAHYEVDVIRVGQITEKVFKIESTNKDYLLKFTTLDDKSLINQLYAHKEMSNNVLPIYPTRTGEKVAHEFNGIAYLTDYVDQIPMPFENRVRDYANLLSELHQATEIVIDKNDDEIAWMYADDYRQLEECYNILESMMEQCEMKLSRSPFEWQILMMYPLIYGMFRRSDEALKKFYRLLNRKKQLPVSMLHGDVNVANVLPSFKSTHLINFESSNFDIRSHDMLKFLSHYHQSAATTRIITDYLKSQKDQLIVHHFFMKSLCIDLKSLVNQLSGNSLIDISILNEKLAPGLIAMSVFDDINAPKQNEKKQADKQQANKIAT